MIDKLYKILLVVIIIYFITITVSVYKNSKKEPIINVVVDTESMKDIKASVDSIKNTLKEWITIECE